MPNPKVTVGQLLDRLRGTLQLEEIEPGTGHDRPVGNAEVSSPGLVLAGYVERFSAGRLQVLGETEITYLNVAGHFRSGKEFSSSFFLSHSGCLRYERDSVCPLVSRRLRAPPEFR